MREFLKLAPFRNAVLIRGAVVWVGVRLMAGAGGVADANALQEAFILLVVGALVLGDARRRNEDLFLANLGIPRWPVGVLGALGALPLELLAP